MNLRPSSAIVLFLLLLTISACKTTEPNPQFNFLNQSNRPDWEKKIKNGEIGFYSPLDNEMRGIDKPPHTKGRRMIFPLLSMSDACRNFVNKKKNNIRVVKIEFLVDEDGNTSNFYILQSAGPCDSDAARGLQKTHLIPAKKDHHNKTALVHIRLVFRTRFLRN